MALAAAAAGVGFGNAGVHLVHGMSYPVAGMNEAYKHPGYIVDHPIVYARWSCFRIAVSVNGVGGLCLCFVRVCVIVSGRT